jgi:hypothetical protein
MSAIGHDPRPEHSLAWQLAEAALPSLDARNRAWVFVMLGAGDSRGAITRALMTFATENRTLSSDLVDRVLAWLDTCIGSDDELRLRQLLAQA